MPPPPTRDRYPFWWPVTVRWGDMDAMGHVNNIMYFQYLESARVGYLESLGWDSRDASPSRQGPVVVAQAFNHRRQLYYPAEVEVGVRVGEIRRRSFRLEHAVYRRGTEEIIGDGSTALAWLDYAVGSAVEIPPAIRAQLETA
jgi:acyl-CoA thioester hydrolase